MTDTAKGQSPNSKSQVIDGKGLTATQEVVQRLRAIGSREIQPPRPGFRKALWRRMFAKARRPTVYVDIVPGRIVKVGGILIGMAVDENLRVQLAIITTVDLPVEIAADPGGQDAIAPLCRFGPGGDFCHDYTPGKSPSTDVNSAEVVHAC